MDLSLCCLQIIRTKGLNYLTTKRYINTLDKNLFSGVYFQLRETWEMIRRDRGVYINNRSLTVETIGDKYKHNVYDP